MNKSIFYVVLIVFISFIGCKDKSKTKSAVDENGYSYEYVIGDPAEARIYTLDNGLTVYLSVNTDEPRIQTLIGVRAGAKHDPRETTGMAHYFEHMMFKGTDKIGTIDWEKESELLGQIIDLFEERFHAETQEEKDRIYKIIDSLSVEASKLAIANEYDRICSMIGASGTNAWTSYEETVYTNQIPSNELERWLILESDRFINLVLRLFHTELETVYEEYNMSLDNDGRKAREKMMSTLFPNHPYGVKVLGLGEHLKNPSMKAIIQFKNDYYAPNNIAICLSGDIDMEESIKLIDKYWGEWEPNENIPEFSYTPEKELTETQEFEVFGPQREFVTIAFRAPSNKTKESLYLDMISEILNNGTAGLIDLNLVKQQKVLSAYAYSYALNDYGIFQLGGTPREGQDMEEIKDLLMGEIDKIKSGDFEEWLLEAIVNQKKLQRIRAIEGNSIVYSFIGAFISEKPWEEVVYEIDEFEKITKQELVDFANEFFKDNYVAVYKRIGVDTNIEHIDKPQITGLEINRNVESEFYTMLTEIETEDIEPVFVDFKELIQTKKIKDKIEYNYIKNESNDIFSLYYIVDMGKNHNKLLPIAINYLKYIGTKDKTIEDIEKEWFRLGVSFNVSTGDERSYVYVSGLDHNLEAAVEIMEEIMANVEPDKEAYNNYLDGLLKERQDAKLNNRNILWGGLYNYALYGEFSPFTNNATEEELRNLDPKALTDMIKELLSYEHIIFYYGPREMNEVAGVIEKNHDMSKNFKPIPEEVVYNERDFDKPKVRFVEYDMVQCFIAIVSKDVTFDEDLMPITQMFNEYYGGSMSSIVFQELREAKGLAYSAYAGYRLASKLEKSNYVFGFIATQPDKLQEALGAINGLLNELALSEESFNASKEAIINQINTQRIIKANIFWTRESNKRRGIEHDIRKDIYKAVQNYNMNDVSEFFDSNIKGKNYDILVVGKKEKLDFEYLEQFGDIVEYTTEDLFGY
jgi:zinc protease